MYQGKRGFLPTTPVSFEERSFWLKPIKEVALNALSGSPVVILDELEEVPACKVLGSGACVFVVQACLHFFREGKIQSKLARVGKGEGSADSVRAFQ